MMTIMQGDAYDVTLTLTDDNDDRITDADVLDVEITLGGLSKTYSSGDVIYSSGEWAMSLTQDETFAMSKVLPLEARVKFNSGDVVGAKVGNVYVLPSKSKEVL